MLVKNVRRCQDAPNNRPREAAMTVWQLSRRALLSTATMSAKDAQAQSNLIADLERARVKP